MVPKRLAITVMFSLVCLSLVLPLTAYAQTPPSRQTIHATVAVSTRVPYSSNTMTDTWDVISLADADPEYSFRLLTLYGNQSVWRQTAGNKIWNREHVWPKSFGTGNDSACGFAYNDLHHLFASEPALNESRSNHPFDLCPSGCSPKGLRPGLLCVNWLEGGALDKWEVWSDSREVVTISGEHRVIASGGRRGDVARALFYVDLRYEGGKHPGTDCNEPDLVLTDDRSLIVSKPTDTAVGHMGMLSTLIRWHHEDPVDARERYRNDVIEKHQGNRNPFIDNPDWVCKIFACGPTEATPVPAGTCAPIRAFNYMPYLSRGATIVPPTITPTPSNTPLPSVTPQLTNTPNAQRTTATPGDASDPIVEITSLQCEGRDEFIRIRNNLGNDLSMSGWSILSVEGPQTFQFPAYTLNPGASVTIHSGPDAPASGGDSLRWTTGFIWNNAGDEAQLMNPQGGVVDSDSC